MFIIMNFNISIIFEIVNLLTILDKFNKLCLFLSCRVATQSFIIHMLSFNNFASMNSTPQDGIYAQFSLATSLREVKLADINKI